MAFEQCQAASADHSYDSPQMQACRLYLALTRMASAGVNGGEPNFGGKLLYTGDLDLSSRAMVIAGNVAGCATLAATADAAAQKQSIRDGVVDFLVTSLDEALRILKNEIRQHKTVAVCIGASPKLVEREMIDRGVQPDLVFAGSPQQRRVLPAFASAARAIELAEHHCDVALLTWHIAQAPARWMPKLDAAALECIPPNSWESRWIRFAPRYLGKSGFAQRVLFCNENVAKGIVQRFAELVRSGAIDAEVSGSLAWKAESTVFRINAGEISEKSFQDC